MTVGSEVAAEIRRLYFAEHWKRGTIATQLGVHYDVVVRVVGTVGRKALPTVERASVLDTYVPFIDETLGQYPRLVCTRLYDMLSARGYQGSMRTLRRYVQDARPQPKTEAFLRIETLAGEQAQVDWGHVGSIAVAGGRRPLWAFVMALAHSRALWGELVLDLDVHSLRRSLVRASVFFGGSPRQWLFDNAKCIVIDRHGDAIRFHEDLIDLAARLHVQPRLCAPRKPHQKGKVERAIRFLKERFFAARTFHSLEHGNAQLWTFLDEIANVRPHPRWPDRSVADLFKQEKPRLLPLPDPLPSTDLVAPIATDKTAFVRLDTNRYSVPSEFARRSLTLHASDTLVRLLDGAQEIARHDRCWGRHQVLETPAHRAALLAQKRQASAPKGRDRLHIDIPHIDTLIERWVDHGRNVGSMVAKTVRLLDAYGSTVLAQAVDEMIQRGTHDIGALSMLCEQHRPSKRPSSTTLVDFAPHVVERDVVPHDLGGYDA